jgi:hypothetical protein
VSLAEHFPHLLVDRNDTLDGTAASSVLSPCRTYRYALARRWDDGPLALWIMLNPSTADAFVSDPTIRRVTRFSRAWMCSGLIVLNLFGLRATDPKALRTHPDPVGPDNDEVISWHLSGDGPTIGPVIAAWGVNGRLNGRGDVMLRLLADHGQRVQCLVRTSAGHPGHALYVSGSATPVPYDAPSEVPQ